MQFRCPNCQQPIRIGDDSAPTSDNVVDVIECPSCHSRFSLSADAETAITPELGTRIGHFELLEVLGEGSFGTVYKAWDPELKRHVALKVPREGRVARDTARLFLREAQAAARITHPNVVSIYEVGLHDGKYYIAMQYIDGITLSQFLRSHVIRPDEAVQLVIRLLRAVQVFHDQGIVHRDLKPGNILMSPDNEPHIADFGLARHENPAELTVTQSGRIVGTLLYMPPEQARGEQSAITPKSDIYALGVILYELLTDQRPFQATSSRTLLYSIQHDEAKAPRKIRPDVPRDLDTICLKAIAKDPGQRFESASAMADDLQRWRDGKPILARPVGVLTRCVKWVRRHRALSAAMLVACMATIAAAIAWTGPAIPDNAQRVVIETVPPADSLEFVLFDSVLRVPHPSDFRQPATSGKPAWLLPGLYKVYGATDDGRYHEVWRTVPDVGIERPAESRFPHLSFVRATTAVDDRRTPIILPSFRLFRDDEVVDSLVPVSGRPFSMGYEEDAGLPAARHRHTVPSFLAGVHEVSWGRFRTVMNQPADAGGQRTWMQILNEAWGDRSAMSDDMPVSGYPHDVAILYCELAGGRLPTHAEYEFIATQGGTSQFPTGDSPAIPADQDWTILPTMAATPDTTSGGVRNLYSSVGEYTDSITIAYIRLYPRLFADDSRSAVTSGLGMDPEKNQILAGAIEIRGAPQAWLISGMSVPDRNVRTRCVLPPASLVRDADKAAVMARVGWRIYRSRR